MKHRSLSSWWITLNIFNPLRVSSSHIEIVELSRGSFVEIIRGGGPHPGPGGEVIPSVSCSTCCPPTSSDIHRHPATRCKKHQYLALFISVPFISPCLYAIYQTSNLGWAVPILWAWLQTNDKNVPNRAFIVSPIACRMQPFCIPLEQESNCQAAFFFKCSNTSDCVWSEI